SSGRTSLALALLARCTAAGEVTAMVDCADAFDPGSAHSAGVLLDRVLWVRTPHTPQALRCTERLLEAHGFALVLLDLAIPDFRSAPATALRLARSAASTGTALARDPGFSQRSGHRPATRAQCREHWNRAGRLDRHPCTGHCGRSRHRTRARADPIQRHPLTAGGPRRAGESRAPPQRARPALRDRASAHHAGRVVECPATHRAQRAC
ncbi:MAG: hypothetical protein JRE57_14230, partial [Deltaproteobacteria bacterium]|nr:hypothetical protein [Deltaproteobacteria bacterium]